MIKKVLFILILPFLFYSCVSSSKLLQSGRYDDAITKAIKKLRKEPSDRNETAVLRKAYKLANKADRDAIEALKLSGQPSVWESVYNHYVRLSQRQEMISRLPDGLLARINFHTYNYITQMALAKRKAADYFDAMGMALLNKGDRFSARNAWTYFQKEAALFPETPGLNDKLNAARQLGMSHVLLTIKNKSHSELPREFRNELLKIPYHKLNKKWVLFGTQFPNDLPINYTVRLTIRNIYITPGLIDRQNHREQKRVEDGWKYVLDKRGNVKKDSAGNDIKVKKYKTIRCQIQQLRLTKSVQLSGTLDYFDNQTGRLIKSRPIASQRVFDYAYATARGNLNAVSDETRVLLERKPMPFPEDLQMIFDAGRDMKQMLVQYIRQDSRLFQ
jgi:hypothetical protein